MRQLGDMLPIDTTDDKRNHRIMNTIYGSNLGLAYLSSGIQFPYSNDIRIHEFSHAVVNSLGMTISAFCDHISGVVSLGTKKQMRWIAARAIVTTVQNILSGRNRPMSKLPCSSVCSNMGITNKERAITLIITRSLPFPTHIWSTSSNVSPELYRSWLNGWMIMMLTELLWLSLDRFAPRRRTCSQSSLLSTTAMAVAIRYRIQCVVRSIMFHVGNLLNRFSAMYLRAPNVASASSCLEYSIFGLLLQVGGAA